MGERATIDQDYLYDIADAIRAKNGSSDTYTPAQMAAAIDGIGITPEPLSVTANGTYTAPEGVAYTPVAVNVQPTLQSKTATQNGTVTPDQGYYGLSQVAVNVQPNLQSKTATQNGVVLPGQGYDGLSQVTVNVPAYRGVIGEIAVSGSSVSSTGIDIASQPVIDSDGMTASENHGLLFSLSKKVIIEFDLILNSEAASNIIWSFGGSNDKGGVYTISTAAFGLYAQGQHFTEPISLTAGINYRMKLELDGTVARLYANGSLIATGTSEYVKYAISNAKTTNIALLYNQSKHSEFNNSHVDNIQIRV